MIWGSLKTMTYPSLQSKMLSKTICWQTIEILHMIGESLQLWKEIGNTNMQLQIEENIKHNLKFFVDFFAFITHLFLKLFRWKYSRYACRVYLETGKFCFAFVYLFIFFLPFSSSFFAILIYLLLLSFIAFIRFIKTVHSRDKRIAAVAF